MPASPPSAESPTLGTVLGYRIACARICTDDVFFRVVGEPLELRPVEFTLLALIHENEGVSAARLAQMLAVTPPNITAWLAKLESRGLLKRVTNAADRRAQVLSLSPAGTRIALDATRRLAAAEREAFAHLTRGEFLLLNELLGKLADPPG